VTTRLWCLRHGQSQNVVLGTAGALPHAAQTGLGRSQATAAAALLDGERIEGVYCSRAVRARDTAAAFGGDPVPLAGLDEVHLGRAEGATDPATLAQTAAVLHAWLLGDRRQRVADGESGHDVLARVAGALALVAGTHRGGTAVVVGHVASLTVGLASLCGLGDRVSGAPLPHAVPFLVETDGLRWRCEHWPSTVD
jgi:broad specificity phosphatase PhoE